MASLVSLLVTDIVGSTGSWSNFERDMAQDLATHDELVRTHIEAAGGKVFKHTGDGAMATFDDPADALDAGVAIQRAIAATAWLVPGGLQLRVAVHAGAVVMRNGDVFGTPVNRAARLVTHSPVAGVIVSSAAAELMAGRPLAGLELVPIGPVLLRGLAEPDHPYVVAGDGLVADVADAARRDDAPDEPAPELPTALSSFVGRGDEIRAVLSLLATHRLVTLTGAGGSGKTRLAQEIAGTLAREQTTVRWIELGALASGDEVGGEIGRAFGVSAPPGVDPLPLVVQRARTTGPLLIAIDNAEHVLDASAAAARTLLSAGDSARALVTSREPLGLPGEVVWRVPTLAVPNGVGDLETADASLLFLARAREQRPALELDDGSRAAVVAICQRLDGMPLALELAAARVRTMSLDRVASGLDQAFRLLTGGARTALERHQTLRASIGWSVDLLSEHELVVFRRLAVFPSSFRLEAAEAVVSDGALVHHDEAADLLTRLVDKSLVQFDDRTGRYRLLETVRQYARERLVAADEQDATHERHAAWWSTFCEEIGRGEHGATSHELAWIMPDVAAAGDWSLAHDHRHLFRIVRGLGWVRTAFGYWSELERIFDAVVTTPPDRRDATWAGALAGLAFAPFVLERTEFYDLATEAAHLLDDDPWGARLLAFGPRSSPASAGAPSRCANWPDR